jgi:hypothetical protein
MKASSAPFTVRQFIGQSGAFIQLDEQYPVLPPNQFLISEMNMNPAAGVTDGQWFEVQNNTASPIDLNGWDLDFGGGSTHTLSSSLILPANGRLLFAQSANGGDGLTPDYVYPNTFTIGSNGVGLSISGGLYTSMKPSGGSMRPGYALQRGALTSGMVFISGTTHLNCAAHTASSYGSNGQHGTPGAANTTCPAYDAHQSISAAFESIKATGTKINFSNLDADFEQVTPPTALVVGNELYSSVWVNTNGILSLNPQTCSNYPCGDSYLTFPSTSLPGNLINKGILALYWRDMYIGTSGGGAWWQVKDPDGTPGSGDEYTIVSWENVWRYFVSTDNMNFQVKFFANGNIEYHFGTMTGGTGTDAVTWMEDPTGKTAFRINAVSSVPGITTNVAWRFTAK